jgi:hypothetical protein
MADYYGATLSVPAHLITPEIKAMIDEYIQKHETEDSVVDGIFTLVSYEARWGEFEEIEEALVAAGITFDRETAPDYGNPAFTMYFRPGITPTPQYVCDVIDVGEVKGLLKTGGLKSLQEKLAKDYPEFLPLEGKNEEVML